jgi:DNA ligase-1
VFAYGLPDGRIYSRTGNECHSLYEIGDQLRKAHEELRKGGLSPHVILFEVYAYGKNVKDISGAFRRQSEQFPDAIAMVHDAIPYDDFVAGHSDIPYLYRKDIAEMYANAMGAQFVSSQLCMDEAQAYRISDSFIKLGQEGVILRNPQGKWTAGKRNEDLTKIKQELTYDLEVVGIKEGKGKYTGAVGTLTVRFNGGTQEVSGMMDLERLEWWVYPEEIIGCIVEVKCMCLTPDGWMREPRFKRVRDDKYIADA